MSAARGEQQDALFNESGEVEESVVEATRRFCDEAWHGDRPKLRHFSLEALAEEPHDFPVAA